MRNRLGVRRAPALGANGLEVSLEVGEERSSGASRARSSQHPTPSPGPEATSILQLLRCVQTLPLPRLSQRPGEVGFFHPKVRRA